jgi:serine/threonine-protein kinase
VALEGLLVLPPDVEIVSISALPSDVCEQLDATGDDYAITRRRSRRGSHIVDAKAAALIRLFRSPNRIIDTILAFARVDGSEPAHVLEQAYPLLFRLWSAGLLVAVDSASAAPIQNYFRPGDSVCGFRLVRCMQIFEDTEVFLGCDAHGHAVAVKASRLEDERTHRVLEHEAAILQHVGPERSPRMLSLFEFDGRKLLVTEWINGAPVDVWSQSARAAADVHREKEVLATCCEVAQAVADLHASGVVHGDIHPRNILRESSGRVRLIDFGLARDVRRGTRSARGGVPFYFEPEYAAALLQGRAVDATFAGEQYSVAALLYRLWTGLDYLDWRLERTQMLRQILEHPPLPFEKRHAAAWPELESVLCHALDKDPQQRFATMSEFAGALRELRHQMQRRKAGTVATHHHRGVEQLLQNYGLSEAAVRAPTASTPLASLNYGAAGIAYALHRIAIRKGHAQLATLADLWSQRAYNVASAPHAFHVAEIGITEETVGLVSLFHSVSGLHFVRALISGSLGDFATSEWALAELLQQCAEPCDNPDLTLGRASLLIGLAELIEALPFADVDTLEARRTGERLAIQLESILSSEEPRTSTRVSALGIAHGWAGLLYALLRWAAAIGAQPGEGVLQRLDDLAAMAEPHHGGSRWPVHNGTRELEYVEGWCNGTAGFAMLFGLACSVTCRPHYARIAIQAAESAYLTSTSVTSLCCGLGGIAYANLAAYRVTRDDEWRLRAEALAKRARNAADPQYRHSLYKGELGLLVLDEELLDPDSSAMPAFEPLIWPGR